MPIYDASSEDLRDAILRLRKRYEALGEPRRWYSAVVCAVLVNDGSLPEWHDWLLQPPVGADIEMTPSVLRAIEAMFSTPTAAVLRSVPDGVVPYFANPSQVMVDPLRQPGRATEADSICVVVDRQRIDVPVDDPSWLWNPEGDAAPGSYGDPTEYKPSNDYQQQQGIACAYPADRLFELGEAQAAEVMTTPRPACEHHAVEEVARRAKATDTGPPPTAPTAICQLNGNQCASKGSATTGPGGPRALVPESDGSNRRLLTPGSFDRILEDANPEGLPWPSIADFALVIDYFHKGGGKALDSNRVNDLIAPEHTAVLFDP